MKNATAMSQGSRRLLEGASVRGDVEASVALGGAKFVVFGCIGLDGAVYRANWKDKYR
jgi:hypothetical protein